MIYDFIIIGGGAAGTGAALYAARRKLKFKLIVEAWGGEVARSGEVWNYPGFSQTTGLKLAQLFREQLEKNQVEIEEGVRVDLCTPGVHRVEIWAGPKKYQAKTVLIATGAHPKKLNIPGEKALYGRGVTYCTTCDGPLFRGKEVAVIGGGNTALEAGLMMAEIAPKVYLININKEFSGEEVLVEKLKRLKNVELIYEADTQEILGEGKVSAIKLVIGPQKKSRLVKVQGVMIHIGVVPNSGLVKVKKNQLGEIMVNQVGQTSHPRIWAAGDVTNHPYKQIAIAGGQGVSALLNIVEFLNKEKV